jgi:glycosyltransferase involved in cell wall biosynthesis
METIGITVILCTYNRCRRLAKALDSAAALTLPDSIEWEVLVVDNNSRDQTREVVEGFCGRYPGRFRYLFELQPGKSHALNAGIREAQGDLLAFMDDDVTVEPTWLKNLTAGLLVGEWVGAGGRILPTWTCSPPRWLPLHGRDTTAPLAAFDKGDEAGELSEPPFGTNMAFRKSLFEKYGGFRIDLGPRPDSEIRSEDTEFGSRLLAAGERLRYEPSAVVYHPVPENRVKKNYFLAWRFDSGRACVRVFGTPPGAKSWHGIPLVEFRRLAVWTIRWIFAAEPSKRFGNKLSVWTIAGRIAESYSQVHGFFNERSLRSAKRSTDEHLC